MFHSNSKAAGQLENRRLCLVAPNGTFQAYRQGVEPAAKDGLGLHLRVPNETLSVRPRKDSKRAPTRACDASLQRGDTEATWRQKVILNQRLGSAGRAATATAHGTWIRQLNQWHSCQLAISTCRIMLPFVPVIFRPFPRVCEMCRQIHATRMRHRASIPLKAAPMCNTVLSCVRSIELTLRIGCGSI